MTAYPSSPPIITAVILAGGEGRRMGGVDKGLIPFRGKPLVEQVLARIVPQTTKVVISANRSQQQYAQYGYPVLTDSLPDFPGPLAGILTALESLDTELLLVVPCDTPLIPEDLVERLLHALTTNHADIAIPFDGERSHAAIMLLRRSLAADLRSYLLAGERKVQMWIKRHRAVEADFSDQPAAFANLNSLEELTRLEHYVSH